MTTWDPDGPGPLGQHLVCGGEFQFAGAVATANIALLDPSTRTWSALGAGFDGPVFALAVLPGGTLSAAGAFQQSGTAAVAHVATWNGSAWTNLGTGTDGDVFAAAVMANGDLAIGGAFTVAGGSPANHVARWNGTTWSALGSGVTGTPSYPVPPPTLRPVTHLGVRSNGELVVAGDFTTAGGIAADGLARWNGTTWSSLGFGPAGTRLTTMRVLQNDDVLVGTDNSFGSYTTQRWNGSTWTTLGLASQTAWNAFCEQPNGTLLAQRTGYLSPLSELLVWNGTAWVAANGPTRFGPAAVFFATGNSELWLAGPLRIEGLPTVTRFDGLVWRAPAAGFDGYVFGVTAFRGDFVLAGSFGQVDHVDVAGIAIRQNGVWAPLGPGVDGVITSVLPASDGTLVVGGWFTVPTLPGTQVTARWDGQQWSSMGNLPGALSCLAEVPNGDVIAGGIGFGPFVARWSGGAWNQLGTFPPANFFDVAAAAVLPNGDVVAGCRWDLGPKVLRWDGTSWMPLGSGLASGSTLDGIGALCVLANGDLVAGGSFLAGTLRNIARWDGVAWQPMGPGLPSTVFDLDLLPNGDLLATHALRDQLGQPVVSPSRWDGTTWTPLPGPADSPGIGNHHLAVDDRGEVLVAGAFATLQGVPTGGLASLFTGCPAGLQQVGAGCAGSAGLVTLTVLSRAWLGSTYRGRASNLPASSLAVHVFGLGGLVLPLATVLPQALPGCTLNVTPDVLLTAVPVAGASTATLAIPASAALVAQTFRHQVVPFELGALGITAITASDAWMSSIGAW